MFKVGDKVVYPMHGAGEIVDKVEIEVSDEMKEYFVFRMPIGDMKVMMPVESVETIGIRPIISLEEMTKLLDAISEIDYEENLNWNKRYRENMDKLKSGDIYEVAKVVKVLILREKEKGLSTGERKMLTLSKQIVSSEMMIVKGLSQEEAVELLNRCIIEGA